MTADLGLSAVCAAYAALDLIENGRIACSDTVIILAKGTKESSDVSGISIIVEDGLADSIPGIRDLILDLADDSEIEYYDEESTQTVFEHLADKFSSYRVSAEILRVKSIRTSEKQIRSLVLGDLSSLNWFEKKGEIMDDNGEVYSFDYSSVVGKLKKILNDNSIIDMNKLCFPVKFSAVGLNASDVSIDTNVCERAQYFRDNYSSDIEMLSKAYGICVRGLLTSDSKNCRIELLRIAVMLFENTTQLNYLEDAVSIYNNSIGADEVVDPPLWLAQCYGYLKNYKKMHECAYGAFSSKSLRALAAIKLMPYAARIYYRWYDDANQIQAYAELDELIKLFKTRFTEESMRTSVMRDEYNRYALPHIVITDCMLERFEDAQIEYNSIVSTSDMLEEVEENMRILRSKQAKKNVELEISANQINYKPDLTFDEQATSIEEENKADADDNDNLPIVPYCDADGWVALNTDYESFIREVFELSRFDSVPAILAMLNAGSHLNGEVSKVYNFVALAVNDPLDKHEYSGAALLETLSESDPQFHSLTHYCLAAALLRSFFVTATGSDTTRMGLRDITHVTQEIKSFENALNIMEAFGSTVRYPIDIYADYRNSDTQESEAKLQLLHQKCNEIYSRYIDRIHSDKVARLAATKNLIFQKDGVFAKMLSYVIANDAGSLEKERSAFLSKFLNNGTMIASGINQEAIVDFINKSWDDAGINQNYSRATLQGQRRNNLRSNINEIVSAICEWYALFDINSEAAWRTDAGIENYNRSKMPLIDQLNAILDECIESAALHETDAETRFGIHLLASTVKELVAKLDGSWKIGQEKYMYADFLYSDSIMLKEDFMPDLTSTFCILKEFNIFERIKKHITMSKVSLQTRIDEIFGTDKTCINFGTADRIIDYCRFFGIDDIILPENAELYQTQAEKQTRMRYRLFKENYALAVNHGQIIKSDYFCNQLEETARYWYSECSKEKNYGFFQSFLSQAEAQIRVSAQEYEAILSDQLDAILEYHKEQFSENPNYEDAIRNEIQQQNFIVAEDWMQRVSRGGLSLNIETPEAIDYLQDFCNQAPILFKDIGDTDRPLRSLLRRQSTTDDVRRSNEILDNWLIPNERSNPDKIRRLFELLGWNNISITQETIPQYPDIEAYGVVRTIPVSARVSPPHPIAVFGSKIPLAENTALSDGAEEMHVVCFYGNHDCDKIYEKILKLNELKGNKIILVDSAIGTNDRHQLAFQLKQRSVGLRGTYLVIDRVMIRYIVMQYKESSANKMLMAVGMPFSYYQPYVVESSHTMPPEIFIGRKDELDTIEDPFGVNLIYGGRQTGKSALFKKAKIDIDSDPNDRAVFIDIKDKNCAETARSLSDMLIRQGVISGDSTDDWGTLCSRIKNILQSNTNSIGYLLIMLDEADAFIKDCETCNYKPLVELKSIQQEFSGRFKYVLAGLHNVIRFNRDVALGNNSVITHLSYKKITPFDSEEAEELLTKPLSYLGFYLPDRMIISQILATVNYYPGLIQLYCRKLIEALRTQDYAGYDIRKVPPYHVSDELLRKVMSDREFTAEINAKFEATLLLDQDQGGYYYKLALVLGMMNYNCPSRDGYSVSDVRNFINDNGISVLSSLDEHQIGVILEELSELYMLRNIGDNRYKFTYKALGDLLGNEEEIFDKLTSYGE